MAGKLVGDGDCHRAFLTGLGVDELFGEARDEMIVLIGVYVQWEVFLLGHSTRGGREVRERLTIAGAGEADHHIVARLRAALLLFVFGAAFAEFIQCVVHVGIGNFELRFFGG